MMWTVRIYDLPGSRGSAEAMMKGKIAALRVVAQYASLRYRHNLSSRAGCANTSNSATPSCK